jgi:hypothetical protein
MLQFLFEHSGTIIILLLAATILYFLVTVAARAEKTKDKRAELMERVKRLQKKLDPDTKDN